MNSAGRERCLIVGCGDLGTRLGLLLAQSGAEVFGLRRSGTLPAPLIALHADLARNEGWPALPENLDAVVFCAAPDERSEAAYEALYIDGLQHILDRLDGRLDPFARLVFVSSSAVWGEFAGAWIDEETPAFVDTFNGAVLLEAEQLVAAAGLDHVVLRLAGIYGPGRDALVRAARARTPVRADPPDWTNRIHIDDAARAIAHLLALPEVERLYIGADDMSTPRHEVLDYIAAQLGAAPLPRLPAGAGMTNKRLSNRRLRLTGFNLRYPDYRAGYAAMLAEG